MAGLVPAIHVFRVDHNMTDALKARDAKDVEDAVRWALAEAKTLEWGSPTLVYLTLKNAKTGAEMAKSNPTAAPPLDQRLEFTAPEDGDVLLEAQHLLYHGGPNETYHLSIGPVTPTLEVVLSSDHAEAAAGATAALGAALNFLK